VKEPEKPYPDPGHTIQIILDPDPAPAQNLFPDPAQNQIFFQTQIKNNVNINQKFISVQNWTAVLFSQTFDVTKCITFGNLYYFHPK